MTRYETVQLLARKLVPLGLVLASTAVALPLGELLARTMVNPGDFLIATLIDDPVLGHRIKPHTTGHDALGFRNPVVPAHANVVAIGDSMTYGFGVAREGSWPYQLGILLGEPVYNMALGGYGPLQYLHLAQREAMKLGPRTLLVGFYVGNDLIDAYGAAYQNPYWYRWRKAGMVDAGASDYLRSLEAEPRRRFGPLRDWLSRHSVLYSLLRATVLARFAPWEQERTADEMTPDRRMVWIDPAERSVRTSFSPRLQLAALDPQLPSVQEGLRITKLAFSAMRNSAEDQGVQVLVVLIPTKECAYFSYVKESGGPMPASFARLCEAEARLKKDLVQFLATEKIAHVDVTGAMEASIRRHIQVYPKEADGHPRTSGHGVIARAIYDTLRDRLPGSHGGSTTEQR